MRTLSTLFLAVALAATAIDGLSACGDKFIRIGRELRFGRYVAIYPAAVLVYGPVNSAPSRVPELPAVLKKAGHSPTVVTTPAELASALASGRYDLVLTGLAQADEVVRLARLAPSHPDVVPVLIEPRAADVVTAKTLSSCLIDLPGAHKNDALAELDHRMELRRLGGPAVNERPR